MKLKFRAVIISLVVAVSLIAVASQPVSALSLGEFFSLSYTVDFSKTTVAANEQFTVTVTGTAVCTKNLTFPYDVVSEVKTTGRIVAHPQSGGNSIVLNSGYTLDIQPAPTKAGESAEDTQTLALKFPAGTPDGIYKITGELIRAQAKAVVWLDVTQYLPASKAMGTLTVEQAGGSGGDGGGGGGTTSTPSPTITPSSTLTPTPPQPAIVDVTGKNLLDYLNSAGITNVQLIAHSDDKIWNISITKGTKIHLVDNNQGQIKLTPVAAPSSNATYIKILDKVYELSPSGTTFDPSVSLTVSYDPDTVPVGLSADKLVIGQWDTASSSWISLKSVVDTTNHTLTTALNHFSSYTILAYTSPAKFVLSDFSISPTNARPSDPVIVKVGIANDGDLSGTYDMIFKINGVESGNKKVTLSGGENQVVSFTSSFNALGYYTISLGSLSGLLTIESPSSPQTSSSGTISETASFAFSDLHIDPVNIEYGKTVKVEFTVTNTSQKPGTCIIDLKLDSTVVETREIALNAGAKQIETFTIANASPGKHMVDVNGITASFSVAQPVNDSKPSSSVNWWIVLAAAVVAVLACIMILLIIRRRK